MSPVSCQLRYTYFGYTRFTRCTKNPRISRCTCIYFYNYSSLPITIFLELQFFMLSDPERPRGRSWLGYVYNACLHHRLIDTPDFLKKITSYQFIVIRELANEYQHPGNKLGFSYWWPIAEMITIAKTPAVSRDRRYTGHSVRDTNEGCYGLVFISSKLVYS